jgi:16S rRNA (cytosine1402-N4)-methyltransferase
MAFVDFGGVARSGGTVGPASARAGAPVTASPHVPVLLDEVLAAVAPAPDTIVVDGTFGAGGYTRRFVEAGAAVVAIDRDPTAIDAGRRKFGEDARLTLVEGRFGALDAHVAACGIETVDAVVLDLGVSSMQLDIAERGFSFMRDGPLDMRMGGEGPSAADLVASLPERALADILYRYGEERASRRIAAAIVKRRTETPIERTLDLAALVEDVLPRSFKDKSHPATRSFQALRIAVNRELEEVANGLAAAERVLKPGGRLVVVTFHSLEDRIVKTFLAERSRTTQGSRHEPARAVAAPTFELLHRKAVEPSEGEIARNPRARSAKLRAGLRTAVAPRRLDLDALGVVTLDALTRGGRR